MENTAGALGDLIAEDNEVGVHQAVPYGAGVQAGAIDARPVALGGSGSVLQHTPGQRADQFPRNPARTIGGYTAPTSTL